MKMSWGRILGILWLGHLVVDLMIGIWPAYKTLAQLDLAKAGLILGISGFIGDGSQLFFGFLGDKGYRRRLLFFGLCLASAAALLAYSTNYFILFFLMLLTYLGSGIFHPTAAGITQLLKPEKRGLAMAIFASGGALGLASSQLFFTFIYLSYAGQTIVLLALSLCVLFLFNKITSSQTVKEGRFSVKRFFETFSSQKKPLTLLYFAEVTQQAVMYAFAFLMPDVLCQQAYPDWLCFGGGHCLFTLGLALMLVPSGLLADRFGPKKVLICSSLLSFVLFYSFLFQLVSGPFFLAVYLMLFGASMGVFNPIGVTLGNRILPKYASSVSALLMGCVWCMAHLFGSAMSGLLTKLFHENAPVQALFVMGFLLPISCLFTLFLKEPEQVLEPIAELSGPVKSPF